MVDLEQVNFGKGNGLVVVVTQDARTGAVLMVAFADREALERTVATGEMHYHSRSRGLWHKGATSGNVQRVVSLSLDCDGDAVLARVRPAGPACHTGAVSCFEDVALAADVLGELDATIGVRVRSMESGRRGPPPQHHDAPKVDAERHQIDPVVTLPVQPGDSTSGQPTVPPLPDASSTSVPPVVTPSVAVPSVAVPGAPVPSVAAPSVTASPLSAAPVAVPSGVASPDVAPSAKPSYTARLLADRNLRLKKLGEEAAELVIACADEDGARAGEEGADLIYHTLVALRAVGVTLDDVRRVLAARAAPSAP